MYVYSEDIFISTEHWSIGWPLLQIAFRETKQVYLLVGLSRNPQRAHNLHHNHHLHTHSSLCPPGALLCLFSQGCERGWPLLFWVWHSHTCPQRRHCTPWVTLEQNKTLYRYIKHICCVSCIQSICKRKKNLSKLNGKTKSWRWFCTRRV